MVDHSPGSSPHSDIDESTGAIKTRGHESSIREQDRLLPIANVGRIMKKTLPANAKISKEAKETMQECVSEFISFVTGEASDKCQKEKRKTINGDDILWAMTTLGFEDYAEPLKVYLHKYREVEGEKLAITKHGSDQSLSKAETNNDEPLRVQPPTYHSLHPSPPPPVFGQNHQLIVPAYRMPMPNMQYGTGPSTSGSVSGAHRHGR